MNPVSMPIINPLKEYCRRFEPATSRSQVPYATNLAPGASTTIWEKVVPNIFSFSETGFKNPFPQDSCRLVVL